MSLRTTSLIVAAISASVYQPIATGQETATREVQTKLLSSFPLSSPSGDASLLQPKIAQSTSQDEFIPLHRQRDEQEFQPDKLPFIPPPVEEQPKAKYKISPGVSIMNPSAYGASWGSVGIGLGFQSRTRFTDKADAVMGIGFGLGDPQKYAGLQIGIGLTDLSEPFVDGSISWKLHRRLPADFSIALGQNGFATWGDTDGGSSLYGVVTKRFLLRENLAQPFSELNLSLGVGGGQFRSESDIDNHVDSVGVFGTVAVRIVEPVSAIAEWTGQDLTLGLSYVPFRDLSLVIVPAVTDVTGNAGDGTRFILGVAYGFFF